MEVIDNPAGHLPNPSISVVIAAYNRPEPLVVAVRSVLSQTLAVLEIVVVGDACDDSVANALAGVDGPIRYVNLPVRHGEQAIPNAVGSALARGEWVAYLNHDDVWLPHHLATSMEALDAGGGSWVVGAAAFSEGPGADAEDGPLQFTDRTARDRSVRRAFSCANRYLEPVSSWVVRRSALAAIGWWRPARDLYRTPTQDLALRLWREIGEPMISDVVTVLKPGKRKRARRGASRGLVYSGPPIGYRWLGGLVERVRVDGGAALRSSTAIAPGWSRPRDLHVSEDPMGAGPVARALARRLVGRGAASLYRGTGFDLLTAICRLFGTPRGEMLGRMLRRRTGEPDLPDAGFTAALSYATRVLEPDSGQGQQESDSRP